MADDQNSASLTSDPGAVIPRISLGETGYIGLRRTGQQITEEANASFRFPQFLKTVDEMRSNPTVAAALNVYRMMLGKVKWSVKPPVGATQTQIDRAKFIESCMDDMEDSWSSFITELLSYLEYGFAVHEKVYRRRLRRNGSKHNDGLVGWKKLPTRSQSTLYKWEFSGDGRELTGFTQTLQFVQNANQYTKIATEGGKITIPRKEFLLFRADATRGNPEGHSILKNCFIAYKQLELIQNQEMIGIARDLGGVPSFSLPPQYLDPNAPPELKAVMNSFVTVGNNLTTGSQSCVVLPLMYDENKNPMFKFELMESKGGKNFDTSKIIQRLQTDILSAMSCDIIKLGGNSGDSFSLADAKTTLLSLNLEYRLGEIADVLNNDLIPQTFALNGWDDTELPKFAYGDFDNHSLEELGKFLQRVKSVGLLEVDREWLNLIRSAAGIDLRPDDEPPDTEALGTNDSKSGASFNTPTGGLNGTANQVPSQDNSVANKENS